MIQRVALFVASLAAAAVLVVGLSAAGFRPATAPASTGAVDTAAATPTTDVAIDPTSTAPVQVDTVYVAAPKPPKTIVEHRTIAAPARDGEGAEHESAGEDD